MADQNNDGISPKASLDWATQMMAQSSNGQSTSAQTQHISTVESAPLQPVMEALTPGRLIDLEKSANRDTVVFTENEKTARKEE